MGTNLGTRWAGVIVARVALLCLISFTAVGVSGGTIWESMNEQMKSSFMRWGAETASDIVVGTLCSGPEYNAASGVVSMKLLPSKVLKGNVSADDTLAVRFPRGSRLPGSMGLLEVARGDTIVTYVSSCEPGVFFVHDPSLFWVRRGHSFLTTNPFRASGEFTDLEDTLAGIAASMTPSSVFEKAAVVVLARVTRVTDGGPGEFDLYEKGSFRAAVELIYKTQSELQQGDTIEVLIPGPAYRSFSPKAPEIEVGDRSVLFLQETSEGLELSLGLLSKWDTNGDVAQVRARVPTCGAIQVVASESLAALTGGGHGPAGGEIVRQSSRRASSFGDGR